MISIAVLIDFFFFFLKSRVLKDVFMKLFPTHRIPEKILKGRLFQILGSATLKDVSPNVLLFDIFDRGLKSPKSLIQKDTLNWCCG